MRPSLAVLIDAENIPATLFAELRDTVELLGDPIIWQVHGDLLPWKQQWIDLAQQHGLDLRQTFSGGKNSADIAMTTAAMDILHAGKARGFCIVSSDSDFAPLARRLRADNAQVYGFGEAKTAEAFRAACNGFHVLGATPAQKPKAAPKLTITGLVTEALAPKPAAKKAPAKSAAKAKPAANDLKPEEVAQLRETLRAICREMGENGWIAVETASNLVHQRLPKLADRIGGSGKFLRNLKKLDLVEVKGEGVRRKISVKAPSLTLVR